MAAINLDHRERVSSSQTGWKLSGKGRCVQSYLIDVSGSRGLESDHDYIQGGKEEPIRDLALFEQVFDLMELDLIRGRVK